MKKKYLRALLVLFLIVSYTTHAQFDYALRNEIEDLTPQDIFAFGDLNGDSYKDIVSSSSREDYGCFTEDFELVFSLNDGQGQYLKDVVLETFPLGVFDEIRIHQIEIADFDNDSDNDITVVIERYEDVPPPSGDRYRYTVAFFKNNGDGTFAPSSDIFVYEIGLCCSFFELLVLDADNDEDLDLFMTFDRRIFQVDHIFNGNFSAPVQQIISSDIEDLHAVDVNGDDFLDVIAVRTRFAEDDIIKVIVNDGSGNLNNTNSYSWVTPGFTANIDVFDIDGDNKDDILSFERYVEGNNHIFRYYRNNGTTGPTDHFETGLELPISNDYPGSDAQGLKYVVTDLQNDNDLDIVYALDINANSMHRLINNGDLSFTNDDNSIRYTMGAIPVLACDLDGDGNTEVIVRTAIFPNTMTAWFGQDAAGDLALGNLVNSETFDYASSNASVKLMDLDGDGDNDLFCRMGDAGINNNFVVYFENFGDGAFSAPRLFSKSKTNVREFDIGDINNDGILDLLYADTSNKLGIVFRNADGSEDDLVLESRSNPFAPIMLDFDGDGDLDIDGQFSGDLWLNDGSGNMSFIDDGAGFNTARFDYKDINGDQYVDYLFRNSSADVFGLVYSTGLYEYETIILREDVTTPFYLGSFSDLNHDGLLDIVYAMGEAGTFTLYANYNLGGNSYSDWEALTSFSATTLGNSFLFEDVYLNGHNDLVYSDNDSFYLVSQNSDGSFESPVLLATLDIDCDAGFTEPELALSDINDDGLLDLLIAGHQNMSWLENTLAVDPALLDFDSDGVVNLMEDLNGDGDLDNDDTDGDGIPNYYDSDDDGDTVATEDEITGIGAGFASGYTFIDTDGDLIENYLDDDDDQDLVLTIDEDYNANGDPIDDDTNTNGIPDFLDEEVALGVSEFSPLAIKVYPNPTIELVTVYFPENIDALSVKVFNARGQALVVNSSLLNANELQLDFSGYASGLYWVQFSVEDRTLTKKILKK